MEHQPQTIRYGTGENEERQLNVWQVNKDVPFITKTYPAICTSAKYQLYKSCAIFLLVCVLCCSNIVAAAQDKFQNFTVENGLPANYVFRCVEDNKGFLWVATDAGLARFDGKYFQLFTTKQGLPDNEVLHVVKDADGTIWVNCFKQSPCYFDEVQNRFINSKEDTGLAKISGTANMDVFLLNGGGVIYSNEKGSFVFRDKKLILYDSGFIIKIYNDGSFLKWTRYFNTTEKKFSDKLFVVKNGKLIDSTDAFNFLSNISFVAADNGKFYVFRSYEGICDVYEDIQHHPLKLKKNTFQMSRAYVAFGFTSDKFFVVNDSAKIVVYDKNILIKDSVISGDYLPNSYYNDTKGNTWISTIDKGLLLYPKKQINNISFPSSFTRRSFISITCTPDGKIYAGNYYGEVIETGHQKFRVQRVIKREPSRQRKILVTGNNIFTISEDGVYMNYTVPVMNSVRKKEVLAAKTAMIFNDTLIIVGSSGGLLELNSVTGKVVRNIRYKRTIALALAAHGIVYIGSTDGLHKYNHADGSFVSLINRHFLFSEKITALSNTPDGLLWIGTSGNGLIAVKNDSVLVNITEKDGMISNECRSITAGKTGQVWVGTTQGISIINYQHNPGVFTIQNLSVNDGLTSNEINEMAFNNDTVYAATGNGISIIPANITIKKFNIPVQLIRLSVNQRDTIISSEYKLSANQQNIQMQFAAIELNGHFQHLEYNLDDNQHWTSLYENTLTLQLSNGKHRLQVRAIDVNGNISNSILSLQFTIATPLWKNLWVWSIVALLLQLLLIYFLHRWQKKKKDKRIAKAIAGVQTASLEQQAFTSLMNPHFIFNALNSVQHYINLQDRQNANRYLTDFASLIRKNFEASQQSFVSLEQEIENLKIYLRLEQMRFYNRFQYNVVVNEKVSTDEWMIPSMMLQPLLENALLHGLMQSSNNGVLTININEQDKQLIIVITDNGIGVDKSRLLKANSNHISRGTELITKRIAALSRFVDKPIVYEMSVAYDDTEFPGTQVKLVIPADLYKSWLAAKSKT